MQTLKEFLLEPETQKIKRELPEKLYTVDFNRDPNRVIYHDESVFYSPADGVIVYSKTADPTENIIPVKGMKYTVNDLLQEEVKEKCLVVGIFMTCLDVHINRIPTNGYIRYEKLPPLKVNNLSMRAVETGILKKLEIPYNNMEYALFNERVRNRIYCPWLKQHYYLVQIADFEVDVIAHFGDVGDFYAQGERFSVVRMGSQVDCVVPLINKELEFKSLIDDKIMHHVEAGVDPIISWETK